MTAGQLNAPQQTLRVPRDGRLTLVIGLPILLFLTAIAVLWILDLRAVWSLPPLNWLVHYGSAAFGVGFIVIAAGRSFVATGQPSVLMLGCGVLMTELGVAAMPTAFARSTGAGFAIYNTSALLSALCHFTGAAISSRSTIRLRPPAAWLAGGYAGATAAMGLVTWLALSGRLPVFFIDGRGGTLLRDLVVGAAVLLFLLTAGMFWRANRRAASRFLYWYALGLVLLAAGLAGSLLIVVRDSLLQWVTRFSQLAGMAYMCVAVVVSARTRSALEIPPPAAGEAWHGSEILAGLRQPTPLGWVLRYGLAGCVVAAAMGLRLALTAWIGPGLPTYITFYPAVMVVALLAGFGPGLAATAMVDAVALYWILPPIGQFTIQAPVDRLGLVLFTAMGVLMSVVAELYRRNRDRAAAYEREMALREGREALRLHAELIDPVRAEIIAREMQRVVRERGGAVSAAAEPAGEMLRRVPVLAGAAVAGVGLLVLIGWVLGLDALRSVVPGMARMKVNTALCFVLAGTALAVRDRRALRVICAACVAVVSALTLAEYVTGANFGIDQLVARDPGDAQTVAGRMAQATGISFMLAGLSLLLVGTRERAGLWAQQAMALAVGALGMMALLGYAYEVRQLYGLAGFSSMSLPTAAALVLLAGGLVYARSDGVVADFMAPRFGGPLARRLLLGAILLPAIIGWLRVQGANAGLFEPNFGTGLYAITMMIAFAALVWWTARALNRADVVRREAEIHLQNQAELMDRAADALVVREPGGAIHFWNRGAEALYGWPAADALGQRKQSLVRIEGHSEEELDRELESTGRWEGELTHSTRDGRRVTVESRQTARRVGDGRVFILESNRDITARKRAEEAVSQSRKTFLELVERSPFGTYVVDSRFQIAHMNAASQTGAFRNVQPVIGRDFAEAMHILWPESVAAGIIAAFRHTLETGEPYYSPRFVNLRRDIEVVEGYEWELHRMTLPDGQYGVICYYFDSTKLREAEAALQQSAMDLKRSNQDLEQFAYVASHDLQEPLRMVRGFLSLLEIRYRPRLDAKAREYIRYSVEGATRMSQLITDLLAYSRVERLGKDLEPTDAGEALAAALANLRGAIQDAGATVTHDALPTVTADATQLMQLFQNLIGNAIKFRSPDRPCQVHVGAAHQDGQWVVAVRDNGIGIPADAFARIFLIFQRLHTREEYPGTGVGLAICKRIVERHGGRIWIESKVGEGSAFLFSIPAGGVSPGPAAQSGTADQGRVGQ